MSSAPAPPEPGAVDLSIVTTLFFSEPYVREFYRRIVPVAQELAATFEIVFVDDGSPDAAAALVAEIQQTDARVVLVELSRNFGHHQAVVAGLQQARGRLVFIIDVDLEEQPEWLKDFADDLERTGSDVVFGVNRARRGSFFKKLSGWLFWKLFNLLSETPVPPNTCTVRLMRRRYLDGLLRLSEKNLFLAGSYAWTGFKQVPRPVQKLVRPTRSSYTLGRLLGLFLDAVTSFTSYPLRLIFVVGVVIAGLAFLAGVFLVVRKLANPEAIFLGWSSIMVSIWFLGGVIISFLGVIGIYVSKVFTETKDRPLYIVRRVRGGPTAEASVSAGDGTP